MAFGQPSAKRKSKSSWAARLRSIAITARPPRSKIDGEVQKLVKRGYDIAKELLSANRDVPVRIALALIEREVLDAQQIKMIIEGQELPKIVPPPKPDDGVQQVIKPDLQPGRAKGGERPAPA